MKFIISSVFIFIFIFQTSGQDKTELAQIYFKRAQNSVEKNDVENAVNYLNKSREYYGGIVSKELAIFGANFFFNVNNQKEAQLYLKAFFDLSPDKASKAYKSMLSLYTDNLDVIDDPSKFEGIKKRKESIRKEAIANTYNQAKANYAANKFEETISAIEAYLSLAPSKNSKSYAELTEMLLAAKEKFLLSQQDLYYSLAKTSFAENKLEEAISAIDKYFALNPKEATAVFIELSALQQKAKDQLNAPQKVEAPVEVEQEVVIDTLTVMPKKDSIMEVEMPAIGSKIYTADLISFMLIEEAPIFPGCDAADTATKACFEQQTKGFFVDNFDKSIVGGLDLPKGKNSVFITFEIDTTGAATHLDIKAIDPKISAEATRVIQSLPIMQPAKLVGKPIRMRYSFLYTFIVE